MSQATDEKGTPPAVRDYTLLGLGALLVLAVVLLQAEYGVWALLPVVPGLLAVLTGWSLGAPVVLLMLTILLVLGSPYRGAPRNFVPSPQLEDMILAAATVAFVAAQMRLCSLLGGALPDDRRRKALLATARAKGRWLPLEAAPRRSPERVAASELVLLLGLAGAFALAGWLLAVRVQVEFSPAELHLPDDRIWRAMLVAWALGLAIAAGKAVSSVLGWQAATRQEAATYLQDQLWSATRGEQRRNWRWIIRARLEREKREEQ
ncbi:MAG: hypothetical protein K2W96_27115 [Gemmataceae bacterium]|nr:hypothetical protein [Gemmataceae bacterium]